MGGETGVWMIDRRLILAVWAFCVVALVAFIFSAPIVATAAAGLAAGLFVWGSLTSDRVATISADIPEEPAPDRITDLINAIDDPLLVVEGQRITHANGAAVDLFGADKLDGDFRLALRHPLAAELLATDEAAPVATPIELVGIGQKDRRWAMTVHKLDGGTRLVRLRDRTDSWVAERMRVDFVANASHELRTPLATLLGFIETLADDNAGGDPATRARFLGIMMGEARRMQQLVNDLMSLSRIEADRFSVPRTPLALKPLVEEVAAVIRTGLGDGADRLRLDLADAPDIRADRVQIAQLLHNLIGNAIKYGRPGTPIRVELAVAEGKVRLRVKDEGDGIAAEHLPRLTERFYRVDPGRSRAVGGTGLGLAIVKHIAERHRAPLHIASVEGQGTTVTVTFPIAQAEALSS
jgi:two-component system phosphate regulon sensor histidine kinase PhoR